VLLGVVVGMRRERLVARAFCESGSRVDDDVLLALLGGRAWGWAWPAVYTGVGLNTEVNIKDRPVTREGMVGIAPGAMGPGRQVVDGSYYVGKLRQKTVELQAEIDKMKAEVEQYHKDSSTYQQYERKYESLIKEVRGLEGQLADYNLAMDKHRARTVRTGAAVAARCGTCFLFRVGCCASGGV